MYKSISLMTILSLCLTSCCTLFVNPKRQVTVTAHQSGTEIFIDGYDCGTAPLLVELDKRYNHRIVASKPGYESKQRDIISERHSSKLAYNGGTVVTGLAIGTGIGLLVEGTGGYALPYCLGGTMIGGAIGLGLGVAGLAIDTYTRADCDLNINDVHFNLIQAN